MNFWRNCPSDQGVPAVPRRPPRGEPSQRVEQGSAGPLPGQSAYGASKAAVKLLTKGMVAKLRASAVAPAVAFPGVVGTNMPVNSGVDIPRNA